MAKSMNDVFLIDEEKMDKYPPVGFMGPHKMMIKDLFLKDLSKFENDLNMQEINDDIFGDLHRDGKYLTQKIEILMEFVKRCEKFRDVLSEDLDIWEVTCRLA